MTKQWKIFLTAVMYFTRIRVPKSVGHEPGYLEKAAKYFPLVGWIVGGISVLVFLVFSRLLSSDIGMLASMIAGLLTTGAFHEDGFADVCDGFGGGWTKEKILLIMKDSRVGAFGVIGLIVILGSKFLLLRELPSFTPELNHPVRLIFYNYRYFIGAVMTAHSLSRLMPVLTLQWLDNVTDPEHSKSKPVTSRKLAPGELLAAILFGILPLFFFPWPFWLVILPAAWATYELAKYFKKWIGGYTGDCLGAIQQVTEIAVYLGWVIVWRYIL
ncbi:MAG TPA: adenosylcobinamide-GDP ribazoletransferase [Puia sp.]|nr:adenosylcobinamide-GDP ribazoletransferase [Puia sp.]